ncbi:MAG TPA: hypothetical protein VMK84_02850 [Streptosporangiaceae bacterium]|nr:hypothetical protein [Streptosporangiaceae bacterium]
MPAGLADLATRDPTDWWEASHDHMIGHSAALRDVPGSLELEEATAELIGGELHAALGREKMGFNMGGDGGGFITIAGARTFGSPDEAAEAWRAVVGQSADSAVPSAVDADALMFLAACVQSDQFVGGRESRSRMDNWYRAYRRLDDIVKALSDRGMELPWERTRTPRAQPVNPSPMVGEFTAWYTGRRGQAPDAEIVEEVAGEQGRCSGLMCSR